MKWSGGETEEEQKMRKVSLRRVWIRIKMVIKIEMWKDIAIETEREKEIGTEIGIRIKIGIGKGIKIEKKLEDRIINQG